MKKVLLFLAATMLFAANVNAQEVHGVESRMVCTYDCNPNGTMENWGRYSYPSGYEHKIWFGYEFTNLNSIPVSVEVELYKKQKIKSGYNEDIYDYVLTSTKSFVLNSGESYIFKRGEQGIDYYNHSGLNEHKNYFVKYKAYKLL